MEIIFLGTGGVNGVPAWSCFCKTCKVARTKKGKNVRTRSSIIVRSGKKTVLVDIGPDFRSQMLREKICKINHVLITHTHMDHTASLIDLKVADNAVLEMPRPVLKDMRYSRKGFENYLKKRNPKLTIREFKPEKVGSMHIDSIKLRHSKDYTKNINPCYGYLFKEKGYKVAYISDFDKIFNKEKVKNLDLLICDGTFMNKRRGHIGIKGGIKLYKELKPKKMLFTHITHHYQLPHKELEEYVKKFGNIRVAWDGLRIKNQR